MRLIIGSYSLFVFILVVSARPNAPSTSTGVDKNGAYFDPTNNTTNRITDIESSNNVVPDTPVQGMEVQSIKVESSMMASSPVREQSDLSSSTTENNDIGRAAISTSAAPIGESLKTVTKQLLQSPTATDMVITDIRTPPKIQQQIELISPGKGEAVPVLIEEENNSFEKMNEQNTKFPSTPSSGLSTWILLNGDFSSTPYAYNKKPIKPNEKFSSTASSLFETSSKRTNKPTIEMIQISSTTEKNKSKVESHKKGTKGNVGLVKPVSNPRKPQNSTLKPVRSTTVPTIINETDLGKPAVTLQDSKFKNKTPIIVGRIPLPNKEKEKVELMVSSSMRPIITTLSPTIDTLNLVTNMTRFGTPVVTFPHVPPRVKPLSISGSKDQQLSTITAYHSASTLRPYISTTALTRNISSTDIIQETTTQSINSTTDKKIKSTSEKKKKKKKKNRRNKPSKKTTNQAESKISVDMNATSKIPGGSTSRPLSTRIYNYLAREVMPNVGIGVVGLMLTAGLAGLLLYPFGGGIAARRTSYERPIMSKYGAPGPHRPHHYYNPNNYNHASVGMDNGQPEEAVLGQVLTGMDYSPYSRERPSTGLHSSGIYDPNDSFNSPDVVGYAGESINPNSKYSTINIASNTNSIKYNKVQQELQEQKHPSFTAETQTESSSVILNSVDNNNQLSPESKFSNMNIGIDGNAEQNFAENISSNEKNKNYKADFGNNDYEKYSVQNYPSNTPTNPYTTESGAFNANDNFNNEFIAYGGSIGSVYNEETGYAQADVKNHRPNSNNYQEYHETKVSNDVKKETENNTNVADQPTYSALEGIPSYNVDGSDDMYKDSSSYNMFNYRNDHGIIIEHGPRNLKVQKRSTDDRESQIDEFNNEVDGVLPDEDKVPLDTFMNTLDASTPNEKISSSEIYDKTVFINKVNTDLPTSSKPEEITIITTTLNTIVEDIKGTQFNISDFKKPAQQNDDFSLVSIIRRITQFKLNLGLSLLRSTSQAFSRYMGSLQQRMENVVRAINDHYRSRNRENTSPKVKKIVQDNSSSDDNFVQLPPVKVKDVENHDKGNPKLVEVSTIKVEIFTKESSMTSVNEGSTSSRILPTTNT